MPPWASQFLGIYESRILIQVRSSLQSPGLRLRESPTYRGKRDRSFLWDPKQVKGAWEGSLETDRERAERSGAETGLRSPAKEAEGSPLFCNF